MQRSEPPVIKTFDASGWKLGIVVAQFNGHITKELLASALKRAKHYKLSDSNIKVVHVAGAVEIPLVLQRMAAGGKYDALLSIGCVIRGDTSHFEYVCMFVTEVVLKVQLAHNIPIGFGVLTCENEAQAEARAGLGGEHLDAVMHQAQLLKQL